MTELARDAVLTPDFATHRWEPLERVTFEAPFVTVVWSDGKTLDCFSLWLFENSVAIDPVTRESTVDPGDLPDPSFLSDGSLGADGELALTWADGRSSVVHPGWLRSACLAVPWSLSPMRCVFATGLRPIWIFFTY